ncbi:unnamed protein product [Somion occarium]
MLPTRCGDQKTLLYPPTDTLVMSFTMQGLWVLPTFIDIEQWKQALAKTLSIFPPAAGRLRKKPDTASGKGDIYLELNNNGITVSLVDDYTTERFPMVNVVVHPEEMEPWIDQIPQETIDSDEPLLRFKFTRLHKTGQMIYTAAWLHALGDGFTMNLFMRYLAHFYRGESTSSLPLPAITKVFLPPPPSDPALADKILPLMKHLRDAKPLEELVPALMASETRTVPVYISFTAEQLQLLAKRAVSAMPDSKTGRLGKVDVAIAYLVLHYNRVLGEVHPEQEKVDTIVNTIDYRGNPAFAPTAMFGNCAITLTCPSFTLPPLPPNAGPRDKELHFDRCLATIASSIRAGTNQSRDPKFLAPYLQWHSELCRRCYQEGKYQYILPITDREITFNSSHAVNWRKCGDFYESGSEWADTKYTRFHTSSVIERYIRIFPANPAWIGENGAHGAKGVGEGKWDHSLDGGIEAAFRLDKSIADTFQARIKQELQQGVGRTFAQL